MPFPTSRIARRFGFVLIALCTMCSVQAQNGALDFDGVDDYVACGNGASISNLSAGLTLEAWIKVANTSPVNSIIRKTGDYNLYVSNGKLYAEVWTSPGTPTMEIIAGATTLSAGTWTHVAFTWNGSTGRLYVNGALEASTATGASVDGAEGLFLGKSSIYGQPFGGSMDEVRIWSRALSQCELQNNMNCEVSAATQTGIAALYHFNQGLAGGNNTGLPEAPIGLTAMAGSGSASVEFNLLSDGGSPVLSYTVTSSPGGITATGASSPLILNGLTNGTTYTFTARAANANGSGPVSTASNAVTPVSVPDAPTAVTAGISNGAALVNFSAPASNGGSAITAYKVTSAPGSLTATAASAPITVSGLMAGTTYTFTVVAINAVGTSAASAASAPVAVAATVPGVPTIGTVAAGNAQVTVQFSAPASNGGSAITSYTATSAPGGFTATGASAPLIVTGLSNGTSYTFKVQATNAIGTSASSGASAAVVPRGAPSAPSNVVASQSGTTGDRASVAFTAPASNGGSAITSYRITSTPGNLTATGAASPIIISGLTAGTAYRFTATATNIVGTSPSSTLSPNFIPTGFPGAPTITAVTADYGSATISFTAPASSGGLPITSYTVFSSPGGLTVSSASSPATMTGLTVGTTYTFTVKATNSRGTGAASASSSPVVIPASSSSRVLLVYAPAYNAYLNAFTGYIYNQADNSETDPIDGSVRVAAHPFSGQVILLPMDNLFLTQDAATMRDYTYHFTYVDLNQQLEFNAYGEPIASFDSYNTYWITSDGNLVSPYDAANILDPATFQPIGSGAYTILQTPASWLVSNTHKNPFAPGISDLAYRTGNDGAPAASELHGPAPSTQHEIPGVPQPLATGPVNTLADASGNNNGGQLNNFDLNGISSNWVSGAVSGTCTAPLPPAVSIAYTGSPYCAAGTASAALTGTAGGAFSSTTGLSIDGGTGVVDLAASVPGTYTVTYAVSGNCGSTSNTAVLSINAYSTWTGAVDHDWTKSGNWCGAVPADAIDAVIPAVANLPILSGGSTGYAHNLTVQSGASFSVQGTLLLYGNLVNNGGALDMSSGTLHLEGGSPQLVPAFAVQTLQVNGGGGFTLSGPSTVGGALTFGNSGGHVILGAHNLTVGSIAGGDIGAFVVTNGSGSLTRSALNGTQLLPVGVSTASYTPLTISSTAGHDWSLRVQEGFGGYPSTNSALALPRIWHITPSQQPTATATTLAFTYPDALWTTPAVLSVYHYSASAGWALANNNASGLTALLSGGLRTVTLSGQQAFSPFAIGGASSPLPVTLLSFNGHTAGGVNHLQWRTASEQANRGFAIERSYDGRSFQRLQFVGSSAPGGNSSSVTDYRFADSAFTGSRQYYRLRQEDLDGRARYSTVLQLLQGAAGAVLTLYPNPARRQTELRIVSGQDRPVQVSLLNAGGGCVWTQRRELRAGVSTLSIPLQALPAGLYRVVVYGSSGAGLDSAPLIIE